jgi:putative ABC transport system substrate-binding protein
MRLLTVSIAFTIVLGILVAPFGSNAQQPTKAVRIGLLGGPSAADLAAELESFRQGLRALGYVEGQSLVIEPRYAEGRTEPLPELATDLVRLSVDVIVIAASTPGSLAAKRATSTIPIVTVGVGGDPVKAGLFASLERPGGNMTGFRNIAPGTVVKRVEILKEAIPQISRAAFIMNPTNPANVLLSKETQAAAQPLGVAVQAVEVASAADFDTAFAAMSRERPDALIAAADPLHLRHIDRIVDFATKNRLPSMFQLKGHVEAGGLMSYGPDILDLYRRAAGYVDKILKGANAGDLPVEQPTKFEFVINLKTAKAIGLTIPQPLLSRADKVIQ